MADRTPPGIQAKPGSGRRWAFGCLGIILAGVAVIGGCSVLMSINRKPYDANSPAEVISQCESRIANLLKAPKTADFSSSARGSGTWTVTGTVDADNSFGATVRATYQCTVIVENADRIITKVDSFDG